jgi:hypothetical protein
MSETYMDNWNKLKTPPKEALKTIKAGRLQGMTDINPQWRYMAMTTVYGPCGIGWKYEIAKLWLESAEAQIAAFAEIRLFIKNGEVWSDPIPGIGGSFFVAKEKSGLHVSDECFKMAITDALSVAMKVLGVGADIYAGLWDGSKYRDDKKPEIKKEELTPESPRWKRAIEKYRSVKNFDDILKVVDVSEENKKRIISEAFPEKPLDNEVECPESGKKVFADECQDKKCHTGCPEFEK